MTPKTWSLSLGGAACLALVWFALARGRDAAPAPASSPAIGPVATLPAPATLPSSSASAEDPEGTIAGRFATRMTAWEVARYPESDQIEEELKTMITDENAAVILQALPEQFQSTYLANEMLGRWARRDRLAAVRWLSTRAEATQIQILIAVRGWGGDEDAALLRHIDGLPPGAWRERLTAGLAQDALNQHDPELAFSMAAMLRPGDPQLRLIRDAAMKWSTWDPRAALAEIARLPDAALQEKLIPYVAIGYANIAPQEAASWIVRSSISSDSLALGLAGVIHAWAGQHGEAAPAKWIERLPRGPVRDRAVEVLLPAWTERNPPAAKAWIERLREPSGGHVRADLPFSQSR